MEMSRWVSEIEMEDLDIIDEDEMNTFCDLTLEQLAAAFGKDYQQSSSESPTPYATFNPSPLETAGTQTEAIPSANKSSVSDDQIFQGGSVKQNNAPKASSRKRRAIAPSNKQEFSCTYDHIIAERKRREKLSLQFIALSAIVPGLKKMNKTSVLGDTIKYLKELQESVKIYQELSIKQTMESVVFVKKIQIPSDEDTSATDENSCNSSSDPLPEIEARVSGETVLIRIHCVKQKGIFGKAVNAIEELNLSVVNCSIIPFGTSTLDITVLALMDEGSSMAAKDLLEKLRSSFCKFMSM